MIPGAASPFPTKSPAGARLTVDLGVLAANWRTLAAVAGGVETAAVVKGDGYGIGLEPAVRALASAGCATFFVAVPEEGVRARAAAPRAAIYVLNGLFDGAEAMLRSASLRPVLGSWPEIEAWAAFAARHRDTPSPAIHVDTGMNRLGLSLREAILLARRPDLLAALRPALLLSHLATADTPGHPISAAQLALFREVRAEFPGMPASLANSAGLLLGAEYRFDLVRPGIALYGAAAIAGVPPLATVVTAEALVIQVREADEGEAIGYGAAERLKRPSRLAILSAGYADGYPRAAGSSDAEPGARVFLRGRSAPVVGRVSMDLIIADVTDVPGAHRGDWAELFGPNIAVDEVATHAGTIGYEVLTRIGHRYERRYSESGA